MHHPSMHNKRLVFVGILAIVIVMQPHNAMAKDWHQWGGPNRNFQTDASKLADRWPDSGPKRVWDRDLGPGNSSIVTKGDTLYTMYRNGDNEVLVALDAKNGKTLWEFSYAAPLLEKQTAEFGKGPNATPLIVGDQIITIGFTGLMHCVSINDGKVLWKHNLVKDFGGKVQEFGYSASPILYKNRILTLVGGKEHGVLGFSPKDGSTVWSSKPHDISYASPIIINVNGQDQIVFFGSTEIIGLDASNGSKAWSYKCENRYKNNATDAIWGPDNILWVATQLDGAARGLKLAQENGTTKVEELWFNKKAKVFHWNAIRVDDHIYASIGGNVTTLAAIDISTGKIRWQERGFHKALCVYADGKLIFLDENGQLALARVSPEKVEILSRTSLTEKVSWTAPTLIGDRLYVRDNKKIIALDLS